MISSRQHPLVKLCRELHSAKGRKKHGLFLVEGQNSVEQLRRSDFVVRHFLDESSATPEILAYASDAQTATKTLAIAEIPAPIIDFDFEGILLVLDGVGDPGNVGTLLRAADAAGASGVVLTQGSCDVWNPKTVRSAAGSLFSLPIVNLENRSSEAVCAWLHSHEIPIFTAEAHGGVSPYETAFPRRGALVLGNERHGVSPVWEAAAKKLTLPMWGNAESLNVAMAGTLLLYAWRMGEKS